MRAFWYKIDVTIQDKRLAGGRSSGMGANNVDRVLIGQGNRRKLRMVLGRFLINDPAIQCVAALAQTFEHEVLRRVRVPAQRWVADQVSCERKLIVPAGIDCT